MPTELIFRDDAYATTATATVTLSVRKVSSSIAPSSIRLEAGNRATRVCWCEPMASV